MNDKLDNEPIKCAICGGLVHAIQSHLKKDHADVSVEQYQQMFPNAPLLSELAKRRLEEARAAKAAAASQSPESSPVETTKVEMVQPATVTPIKAPLKRPMHELFGLRAEGDALNSRGEPVQITVLPAGAHGDLVPETRDYVFEPEQLKDALLAIELNIPLYVWGHKGTGKTELIEQIAARTKRPLMRIQHTVNTEESHIVGQWTSRGGETHFELGPLAVAMQNGWIYLADEYDFALPSVLGVYQAALEGKALIIKQADAANRVIKPHPNFRFVATGNTNGSGDESGLYQGTSIQNSANYDRFGCTINKKFMSEADEARVLIAKCGLHHDDARDLAKFAKAVRDAYEGAKISELITPRALISAAQFGVIKASFRKGIALAFTNKLGAVDKEVVDSVTNRVFPS
ncbi:AAA family ATPase [Burkholderia gladioli]|uniref:AAA family ATPase n=1 Tax=Burkholderia gladioli TaxID=28095 RepID=UPI003B5057EE